MKSCRITYVNVLSSQLTLNRPRGPHRRRPRRAISAPVASLANTATKEELEHGEDFTHWTGSDVAHNRLTRVQSTPVASITAASLAESEAEQQHLKAKPEKRMERVSPKEHRKKVCEVYKFSNSFQQSNISQSKHLINRIKLYSYILSSSV